MAIRARAALPVAARRPPQRRRVPPVRHLAPHVPLLRYGIDGQLSKIVFTPSPARDDFAAAAICHFDRLAYVTAGARRWAILDPVPLAAGDQLTDAVGNLSRSTNHRLYS